MGGKVSAGDIGRAGVRASGIAGVGDMGGKVSAGDIGRAGVRASGIAGVGGASFNPNVKLANQAEQMAKNTFDNVLKKQSKHILDPEIYQSINKEHIDNLRGRLSSFNQQLEQAEKEQASPNQEELVKRESGAMSIGDISGVQTSVGTKIFETESNQLGSSSNLQNNIVNDLNNNQKEQGQTGAPTQAEQMFAEAKQIKDKANKQELKEQTETLINKIDEMEKLSTSSANFKNEVTNLVSASVALSEFANQNNIRVNLTDVGDVVKSGGNINEATDSLAKQAQLISMMQNIKSRKK
ncbi:MAG: hypothetical protein JJW01_00395 [Alphaproteobacteria bacterium]|nr:hypothetical protein [Rickettsiales bacterium]